MKKRNIGYWLVIVGTMLVLSGFWFYIIIIIFSIKLINSFIARFLLNCSLMPVALVLIGTIFVIIGGLKK